MKKSEVIPVLEAIATYYPTFKIDDLKKTAKAWHLFLHDVEYADVMKTLNEYIKTNKFAPTIADLLKLPERRYDAVPNVEETKIMLNSPTKSLEEVLQIKTNLDTLEIKTTSEQAELARAATRRLLGIGGASE